MANYYTEFSVLLDLTEKQTLYAIELHKQAEAKRSDDTPLPDDFPKELECDIDDWCFDAEEDGGLWLHSQEGGLNAAASFIAYLLSKFELDIYVTVEWANTCDKPRTDGFGGGAYLITKDTIKCMTTSEWLQQAIHDLNSDGKNS